MLDKSLPYKNVILRAELSGRREIPLPAGTELRLFCPGDEVAWASIETSVGEFASASEALAYFQGAYLPRLDELRERCFLARKDGVPVGTCTAWTDWKDGRPVGSLHWLAVRPEAQGCGIGCALTAAVLNAFYSRQEREVWLHTQTWSHRAIGLYARMGFRPVHKGGFSHYQNDWDEALPLLRQVMPSSLFALLTKDTQ